MHMEYVILLLFCCNNIHANTPYCYVTHTLFVLLCDSLLLCDHYIFERMLSAGRNVRYDQVM